MNGRIIDINNYARKDHFNYFKTMDYPYVGVTVNVDITEWLEKCKEKKNPFFLSFLYNILNAANGVKELRQRVYKDGIIEFDQCNGSYTVALEDETYCYCSVNANMPFEEFLLYAAKSQEEAKQNPTISDGDEAISLFFISTVPWISYTSLVQPVPKPADSNPRITWGKYFKQGDRTLIPVSILCHHGIVDGIHIARFYDNLERMLKTN